jgi:3-hydroxymyristoyl/3-hydroxydecanoyl-(acyl carrier protein) dehydratase
MTLREIITAALRSGPTEQPDGSYVCELSFDTDCPVFAGHFPGRPLLPGIFQIEIARLLAERIRGTSLHIREISRSKFSRAILPGETVRVTVKISVTEPPTVRATFTTAGWPAGETLLVVEAV